MQGCWRVAMAFGSNDRVASASNLRKENEKEYAKDFFPFEPRTLSASRFSYHSMFLRRTCPVCRVGGDIPTSGMVWNRY